MNAMALSTKRETSTAYHEAGHAVVGFWAGVPTRLIQVSIVPDPDAGTLGHVRRGKLPRVRDVELGDNGQPRHFYRDFDPAFDESRIVERQLQPQVVECFGGVLAEKRFTGRRHNWAGAASDMWMADRFIGYLTGSARQAQKYSDYLWVVADDLVSFHWPEIGALAGELAMRKTMTGRDVKTFLWSSPTTDPLESLNPL